MDARPTGGPTVREIVHPDDRETLRDVQRELLGGSFQLQPREPSGTVARWSVPRMPVEAPAT